MLGTDMYGCNYFGTDVVRSRKIPFSLLPYATTLYIGPNISHLAPSTKFLGRPRTRIKKSNYFSGPAILFVPFPFSRKYGRTRTPHRTKHETSRMNVRAPPVRDTRPSDLNSPFYPSPFQRSIPSACPLLYLTHEDHDVEKDPKPHSSLPLLSLSLA